MANSCNCGKPYRYNPHGSYSLEDGHGMGHNIKHVVGALRGGHPAIAVAHGIARAASVAGKEAYARMYPYECPNCGTRSK